MALKTLVSVTLGANQPMFIAWGRQARTMLYNDAYAELAGSKHPTALGADFADVWAEAWDELIPLFERVYQGEPLNFDDITLFLNRQGQPTEAHFAFSYTPVRDESGAVAGLFCACRETTDEVARQRTADSERARLAALFEQAPGFMAMLRAPEHNIERCNPAYLELIGNRDIIGKRISEALPEAVEQGYIAMLDDVFRCNRPRIERNAPYTRNAADGTTDTRYVDFVFQPVMFDGKVDGILVMGSDVTEGYLAASAVRLSEARFRAAIDAVQGVIWTNTPEGEMRGEQPSWSALTGQSRDEYRGYGWSSAVHPDDAQPTIDAWQVSVETRTPFAFEHRVRVADGSYRLFSIRAIPTLDDNGAIREWIGVHTDITDARAAEAALRESYADYDHAAELNPQVAWTATPDGLLDRVAERWRTWTGTSGLGDTWGQGLHPDDLEHTTKAWVHSVTSGEPYDVEHRVKFVGGRFRWARSRAYSRRDDAGAVVKWYGSTEDVHERHVAVDELRRSEAQFRGVAEAMPGFLWSADDEGAIIYTSPHWHRYSGTSADASTGSGWGEHVHPDDRTIVFERWAQAIATGDPYETEFRLRAANGEYHWWLARARKPEGQPGWVGISTEFDVIVAARETLAKSREMLEVEVRKRTDELRATEDQLRQSQKLEAVGQLTGGVAHDFNNLLTVIRGSVDLLRRPGVTDERRDRYIEAISDTVTRAAKLTGQLLAFARRQALNPTVFCASAAIRGLDDMLRTLVGATVGLDYKLNQTDCHVRADSSQFDTALVNIVVNARDAMAGEGRVLIEVLPAHGIPATRSHPAADGAFIAISITDTGSGIAPEALDQIFEPFFTTKGIGQGTGLGLSQVYGFAKQSGGEVRVDSEHGHGAKFTLYLPCADAALTPSQPIAAATIDGAGTRVLVVEDNRDVGSFAEQTLNELGYLTVFVENGVAALELLAERPDDFDVVFSDVMMPGMNGIDLARAIRERLPDLPVVLTSGYSHVLAQHGSDGFELLRKPYSMDELSAVLSNAAARRT